MIFHRLGLISKNQRGFTLMEIIIAVAISGIIAGAATTAIFQVFTGNARTSNHMTAVKQVQNAGYWISHDTQMAQSVEPADESDDDPDGTRFPLTLTWTDWETKDKHQVVYSLADMSGGLKQLQRQHYTNYDPVTNPNPDATAFVAEYINPDPEKTKCDFAGGKLTLTVTATVGTQSETRVYEIVPRPGS